MSSKVNIDDLPLIFGIIFIFHFFMNYIPELELNKICFLKKKKIFCLFNDRVIDFL